MKQSRALLYNFSDGVQKGVISAVAEAVSDGDELMQGWLNSTHIVALQRMQKLILDTYDQPPSSEKYGGKGAETERESDTISLGEVSIQAVLATYPEESPAILLETSRGKEVVFYAKNPEDWIALLGIATPGATMETQTQPIVSVLPECLDNMKGRSYDLSTDDVTLSNSKSLESSPKQTQKFGPKH